MDNVEEGRNNSPSSAHSDSDEGLDMSLPTFYQPGMKVFHDFIHPHMELHYLSYQIINTPQFQRLRNLKQLGACSFVYPSASHNRFEHCIGTSYLAAKYGRILQRNQPELQIDARDILCLEVAGLCHDIGHGPFSHLWEHFMNKIAKDGIRFDHEEMSIKMLDFLIQDNNLWASVLNAGLDEQDLMFIKEAIYGRPLPGYSVFTGRTSEKFFLYQIVCNGDTKIDVDKFDYLLRDSKQLNIPTAFDYERVLENSRVVKVGSNGEFRWEIAYRQKIRDDLEELFRGRYRMHQTAYQHRVIRIVDEMITDGLIAADPYFRVLAQNGKAYKLSTSTQDPSAFMQLTDSVLELIVNRGEGGPKAQSIFKRILRRDLYKYLGYFMENPEKETLKELVEAYPQITVLPAYFNFGKGKEHPLNSALFYSKTQLNKTFRVYFSAPPTSARFHVVYKSGSGTNVAEELDLFKLKNGIQSLLASHMMTLFTE